MCNNGEKSDDAFYLESSRISSSFIHSFILYEKDDDDGRVSSIAKAAKRLFRRRSRKKSRFLWLFEEARVEKRRRL